MKIKTNQFLSFVICTLIFMGSAISLASRTGDKNKSDATKKCLIVSDIHFNPLYGSSDTGLKRKLSAASFEEWKKYFESVPAQTGINQTLLYMDANYGVLKSAIANMKKRLPHPAFITIAGDFIWHGAKPADSILKRKSVQFIAGLFKQSFPDTPIIPAMGNNDTYGDDYVLQDGHFLNDFANAWQPNLPKSSADSLKIHGYYAYTTNSLKLIAINSALLNNGSHYQQAIAMLKWLQSNLADPGVKNVWIVMHIPPGINVYNGANFWNPGYTKTFINTVVKYAPKVKFCIASHTHFNDFRVFYNIEKKPVAFMRIMPSICSNHGNNPSFDITEFDSVTGNIIHETNYYLDIAAITKAKSVTEADWNDTISLPAAFKLDKISALDLSKFMDKVKANQSFLQEGAYSRFYTVGTPIDSSIRVSRTNYLKYLQADSLK